jgi:hypothetical protein
VQAIEPLEMSLMTTVSKLLSLTGKLWNFKISKIFLYLYDL